MLTFRTHDIMIFGGMNGKVASKNFFWKWMSRMEGENDEMGIPNSRERSRWNKSSVLGAHIRICRRWPKHRHQSQKKAFWAVDYFLQIQKPKAINTGLYHAQSKLNFSCRKSSCIFNHDLKWNECVANAFSASFLQFLYWSYSILKKCTKLKDINILFLIIRSFSKKKKKLREAFDWNILIDWW